MVKMVGVLICRWFVVGCVVDVEMESVLLSLLSICW